MKASFQNILDTYNTVGKKIDSTIETNNQLHRILPAQIRVLLGNRDNLIVKGFIG